MKIAVPVDSNTKSTEICMAFARAPYFYIYDSGTKKGDYIANTAASQPGGAGIKAAQLLVDNKVNILLTPRCGENAAVVLKGAKVLLYKTEGTNVEENIEAGIAGKLSALTESVAGHHKI